MGGAWGGYVADLHGHDASRYVAPFRDGNGWTSGRNYVNGRSAGRYHYNHADGELVWDVGRRGGKVEGGKLLESEGPGEADQYGYR